MVMSLARHQVTAGHDVTICSTNVEYPSGVMSNVTGVIVIEEGVKNISFPVQWRPLLVSIELTRWLRDAIGQFDVVHIHGIYRFPQMYAAQCAYSAGIPYLIRPCGSLDPFLYKQSKYSVFLKRLYEKFIAFPRINRASAVHYTAEDEKLRVAFLGLSAPSFVLPNGVDWSGYRSLPEKGRFRQKINVPIDRRLLLFLGRINFKKGLDLLIPAFSIVKRRYPEVKLAIVGPDNERFLVNVRRWCVEFDVVDDVIICDHLESQEVREAYVDSDVFVLPSYSENFGMTVAEAMACGCPVVISDQVNIWREVKQAKAGAVVGLKIEKIAEAIIVLLEDSEMAGEMGKAGRNLVQTSYTWDSISVELQRIYEKLLARQSLVGSDQ